MTDDRQNRAFENVLTRVYGMMVKPGVKHAKHAYRLGIFTKLYYL